MITRIRINGFKNLVGVDLSFGPFTCIAGGNATGKSNLFDAIMFLSALADCPLTEAAMRVRDENGKTNDIRSLFHRTRKGYAEHMSFEAEMIIPRTGVDDLGQPATASITFLRYRIEISYRPMGPAEFRPALELTHESLEQINQSVAADFLPFRHSPRWRKSAIVGRRSSPFISTVVGEEGTTIRLHQEGGGGRARLVLASALPRTVLSTVNAAESPTAVLVRRELQSWRLLQLEPSALRAPDPFSAPIHLGSDGSHLPATLFSLSRRQDAEDDPARRIDVAARVSSRLSDLVDDVRSVSVDRDEKRELLTLYVEGRDGAAHAARSLSDGTLRFLALAVLEADPEARGVLCLEEPENGIHPERIEAMIRLLQDLSVDTSAELSEENPLRQVIINTHSPTVVAQVPDDSLLLAERLLIQRDGVQSSAVAFRPLVATWRANASESGAVHRGRILAFLNPVRHSALPQNGFRRVIDNDDIRAQLTLWSSAVERK